MTSDVAFDATSLIADNAKCQMSFKSSAESRFWSVMRSRVAQQVARRDGGGRHVRLREYKIIIRIELPHLNFAFALSPDRRCFACRKTAVRRENMSFLNTPDLESRASLLRFTDGNPLLEGRMEKHAALDRVITR